MRTLEDVFGFSPTLWSLYGLGKEIDFQTCTRVLSVKVSDKEYYKSHKINLYYTQTTNIQRIRKLFVPKEYR